MLLKILSTTWLLTTTLLLGVVNADDQSPVPGVGGKMLFCSSNSEFYLPIFLRQLNTAGKADYVVLNGSTVGSDVGIKDATFLYVGAPNDVKRNDCITRHPDLLDYFKVAHSKMSNGLPRGVGIPGSSREQVSNVNSEVIGDPGELPRKWLFAFCYVEYTSCGDHMFDAIVKLVTGEYK